MAELPRHPVFQLTPHSPRYRRRPPRVDAKLGLGMSGVVGPLTWRALVTEALAG
jgi:hypothetical protein